MAPIGLRLSSVDSFLCTLAHGLLRPKAYRIRPSIETKAPTIPLFNAGRRTGARMEVMQFPLSLGSCRNPDITLAVCHNTNRTLPWTLRKLLLSSSDSAQDYSY